MLESPRIRESKTSTIFLDGIETGVLLKDFVQNLKRKDVDVPDIYFTLLDAVSNVPDFVINNHAEAKVDPFQNLNNKSGTDSTPKDLQPMVRCAIWQKQLNSLQQTSENFYIQILRTLGSQKQHVNSDERASKIKSDVCI